MTIKITSRYWLGSVFGIVVSILLLIGCKKQSSYHQDLNPILEAHKLFNSSTKSTKVSAESNSLLPNSLLQARTPIWENAFVQTNGDTIAVFVPLKLHAEIKLIGGGVVGDILNDKIFLRMVTINNFESSKMEMVSMIPNAIWDNYTKFNGVMLVEDWFHPGAAFIDLRPGKSIHNRGKLSNTKGEMSTQGYVECVQVNINVCVSVGGYMNCETTYHTTCTGGGGGGWGGGSGYNGDYPSPGGGPGGGGVTIPVAPSSKITNNITEPCTAKIVNDCINNGIKNEIATIINNFVNSDVFNITFKNVPSLSDGADATTRGTIRYNLNGDVIGVDLAITLSDNNIINASKEYITGVIIHEAVHAYLRTNVNTSRDLETLEHARIANSYIVPLSNYLVSTYNIPLVDAYAISWRGLMATDAYRTASTFNVGGSNISKTDMVTTAVQYLISQKGQPKCN